MPVFPNTLLPPSSGSSNSILLEGDTVYLWRWAVEFRSNILPPNLRLQVEDGGSMFLRNAGTFVSTYKMSRTNNVILTTATAPNSFTYNIIFKSLGVITFITVKTRKYFVRCFVTFGKTKCSDPAQPTLLIVS